MLGTVLARHVERLVETTRAGSPPTLLKNGYIPYTDDFLVLCVNVNKAEPSGCWPPAAGYPSRERASTSMLQKKKDA
ncbi:hypothetical protein CYMTET_11065 [Cymbomonas tetramitiformis]|uniref:Uncharacterized protein n=1 Tax=Cymbomonas tetramitiformis TaxID=36881 RepID=A0AAE0GNC2_9CHLO|nr:hypothetical protein CYMTET_11065 [Cymbomonas tetramitiformis]